MERARRSRFASPVIQPPPVILLPPNRVRRNYRGGKFLDMLQGEAVPRDGDRPEDWLASTTPAVNPGLPPVADEGLASCELPGGERVLVRDLLLANGDYYFGVRHFAERGAGLGFLAKLLDASMRLHIQAHPTAEFAQRHLNSRWGKFETYVIMGCREGVEPYILLGFQRPPSPGEWRRIVLEQDLAAMVACFDPVPAKPGEVWMVPGGLPHALGEGLLLLEVMEPSDLVVRCEHTREGIEVPPAGRYMGRDPDLALQIFDFTPLPVAEVGRRYRVLPVSEKSTAAWSTELLIGPEQTSAFEIRRFTIRESSTIPLNGCIGVWVVLAGTGLLRCGPVELPLKQGAKFLAAAQIGALDFEPMGDQPLLLACCNPGIGTVPS